MVLCNSKVMSPSKRSQEGAVLRGSHSPQDRGSASIRKRRPTSARGHLSQNHSVLPCCNDQMSVRKVCRLDRAFKDFLLLFLQLLWSYGSPTQGQGLRTPRASKGHSHRATMTTVKGPPFLKHSVCRACVKRLQCITPLSAPNNSTHRR